LLEEEAGARIRTADLLITNPGGTMGEAPVFCGFLSFDHQLARFSFLPFSADAGDFRSPTDTATDTGFRAAAAAATSFGGCEVPRDMDRGVYRGY
jgi:hypothetical protein